MDICGVDFIESNEKPYFIEANFTPGIMADFFGEEIADKICEYISKKC
jgi:glutathione synthase/RimK-type ligase-like ATP-grasp enzyme